MRAAAGPCFDSPFRIRSRFVRPLLASCSNGQLGIAMASSVIQKQRFLHKILRYNSSLPKPGADTITWEIAVRDLVFILATVIFFALSTLYLRGCERLKYGGAPQC